MIKCGHLRDPYKKKQTKNPINAENTTYVSNSCLRSINDISRTILK